MRNIELLSKFKVLAVNNDGMLSYHKGRLYYEDGHQRNNICDIPQSKLKSILCKFRLTERLLRLEPRVACSLGDNEFLISCSGWIYLVNTENKTIMPEMKLREYMNNPLSFTKTKAHGHSEVSVIFGEYFSNNSFEEVSIYERTAGVWEKIYSFDPGTIYHIHSIVNGDNDDTFFVLTGDSDNESGIWLTTDHFKSLEQIVGGSQQYRSCVAFPYKNGLLYATDTPRENNYIYYLNFREGSWNTKRMYEMPGPCIYGTKKEGLFLFATSVEADDTLPSWKYRISNKLGAGVKDYYSHIISVNNSGEISEEARLKKDWLPMLLFQFGNCLFPDACDDSLIICTPISVKKLDGKTVCLKEKN